MKVARTVRRGEVGKGLSCETTCRRQAGLRERRYLAGPLPYLHHLFVLWGETGDPQQLEVAIAQARDAYHFLMLCDEQARAASRGHIQLPTPGPNRPARRTHKRRR